MNIFTAIGQFFTNWGAKLASTFLEDDRYMMLVDGLRNTAIITLGACASASSSARWWPSSNTAAREAAP